VLNRDNAQGGNKVLRRIRQDQPRSMQSLQIPAGSAEIPTEIFAEDPQQTPRAAQAAPE
jgi:hypothetical protein